VVRLTPPVTTITFQERFANRLKIVIGWLPDFLDSCSLALQLSEVIKLGSTNPSPANPLNTLNRRRVHGENTFHSVPERNLANRESGADSIVPNTDHDALESLDSELVALFDFHVDPDGVTRFELREFSRHIFLLNLIHYVHGRSLK
jgi:hypothetical protein